MNDGEAFGRSEGTLNLRANRLSSFPASALPIVQLVQVMGGQVVTGNDAIRVRGCDRVRERLQRHQAPVGMGLAHRIHLAKRVSRRTDGVHGAPGLGQSHGQTRGREPPGRCRN
jgi:hypothetical protein